MSSAESLVEPYPETDPPEDVEFDTSAVRKILLGQQYKVEAGGISRGALAHIDNSIKSYPYGSDPHTKVHSFGIAYHAIELANPNVSSETINQLVEPLLIDGMKKCFDYGNLYDFRKLEGVLRALTPQLAPEKTPTLMALRAIVEASGGGGNSESDEDEEGRVGGKTRRLAGGIIRYAFLKEENPGFDIPKPRSES